MRMIVTLELVPGAEPIQGRLACGEFERRFSGWLELNSALEAASATEPANASDDGRRAAGVRP